MKKIFLLAASSLFAMQTFAGTVNMPGGYGLPSLEKNEKYDLVRAKMLEGGWKPYHSPDALDCQAGDKRCAGKPEMEACSDVEQAPCAWLWRKANRYVVVSTVYGDDADVLVGVSKYLKH